jgi:hypothetical protein
MSPSGDQVANKTTLSRLYRWALRLSEVRYDVHHIPGHLNVFADLLTRWGARPATVIAHCFVRAVSLADNKDLDPDYLDFVYDRVRPLYHPHFEWPDLKDIQQAQRKAQKPENVELRDGTYYKTGTNRIWIPVAASWLRSRITVISHFLSGHGSPEVMHARLKVVYYVPGILPLLRRFSQLCLHCDTGPSPSRIGIACQSS